MKIQTTMKTAVIVALLSATSGCMWSRVKVNDSGIVLRSHAVKEGITREKDLKRILGVEPSARIPGKDSLMLGYPFSDTKHHGLMLLVVNFTRSTTVAETLYIEIDRETGRVKNIHRPEAPSVPWRFWPFPEQ